MNHKAITDGPSVMVPMVQIMFNRLSRQIYAVPDLCCIVSRRLVESVGGVFDPVVSSAIAVFEHVKDELAVIPCLLLATL